MSTIPDSEPLISVILPCRNALPLISRALESVWSQKNASFEVIVADGASTDGTIEWLERQRARISHLRSRTDSGIYDAMNDGVAAARGSWVYFMGADDQLADSSVFDSVSPVLRETAASVVVGEAVYSDGRVYGFPQSPRPAARNFAHHQGMLYRRSLFGQHGSFDTRLKLMADYDFNVRLWKSGTRFEGIPNRIALCRAAGASDRGSWRGYAEEITVRHRHFPLWQCVGWDALSVIRFARKNIVRALHPRHG